MCKLCTKINSILQETHDLDSFGHTVTVDEEDLNAFEVPFLTNDLADNNFLASDNQVCLDIVC